MESYNSSALSYFHQSVQDNTSTMSITSNEQHCSDNVFSATLSTSSATSHGSTSVHGNTSHRQRQRKSSSSESNETNFVPPRNKSYRYANLPDDVAEFKRLKVNQLEKERQRQLNEVFQELKDLNLPELVDPGTRMKKYSKSYIVRNTHCILQHLHNERHRLHQKLQQKIQRQELVLVGQGIVPNKGQGSIISEILGQVQPQHGVEGVQKVACIGYSDFIVASSIPPANKTVNTPGRKSMQTHVNAGRCEFSNARQVQRHNANGRCKPLGQGDHLHSFTTVNLLSSKCRSWIQMSRASSDGRRHPQMWRINSLRPHLRKQRCS